MSLTKCPWKMYSSIEIAQTIKNCKDTRDLMALARVYWYLCTQWNHPHWSMVVNMVKVKEKELKNSNTK